jgi:hypothetical protein
VSLDTPAIVTERLQAIEQDLANRQLVLESAAWKWYRAKRDREKAHAEAFLAAEGTVAERRAIADRATAEVGRDDEAAFEAHRAVTRVLDTRAAIGMSILRSQGRAGG